MVATVVILSNFVNKSFRKVNCDLGIHSGYYGKVGLLNTALVKCYCQSDSRVIPLIMFVKHWARRKGILESRFALGSYALELMVLNYLQCQFFLLSIFIIFISNFKNRLHTPRISKFTKCPA